MSTSLHLKGPRRSFFSSLRKAMINKVSRVLWEAESRRKENFKLFEQKKILKAKVVKMLKELMSRPECH
jgi:hypothetical protein